MAEVLERVDRLEEMLMRLVYTQQKTEMEIQNLKKEMQEFKNEMKAFKDEMKAFKEEMKVFKDEMLDFKEWSERNIENMNRQWEALANKMGTLVEDIFAPSIVQVLKKYFNVKLNVIDKRKYRGIETI